MKNTWKKKEHLKSRKAIETLFSEGKKIKKFPIRLIYKPIFAIENGKKTQHNTKAAFSVPKKLHKNAVDRNKIRRQMREAYRLNKILAPESYHLFFIYYTKDCLSYDEIQDAIKFLLNKINTED